MDFEILGSIYDSTHYCLTMGKSLNFLNKVSIFIVEDIIYFLVLQKYNEQVCMQIHKKHEFGTKLAFVILYTIFLKSLVLIKSTSNVASCINRLILNPS